MIIGINALYIKWGINAGTETYFTNIVKPWYINESSVSKFLLLCNEPPPWWDGSKKHFNILTIPKSKNLILRVIIEQFLYPLILHNKVGLLFNPGYVGSYFLSIPQVTTIHDGFAWRYPNEIGLVRSFYWKNLIPITSNRAKRVIAVSKNTAKDISRFCGIEKNKIKVIYEGGSHFDVNSKTISLLERMQLQSKGFFHCVGFFKDIKNPIRILDAFASYRISNPSSNKKLVLTGHVGGNRAKEILNYAESLDNVLYVGRVSDSELVELYQNSLGLMFPSLYEGFGIPILEAQGLGCPVVTSNISSMPEVAGDGAIFVNPLNVDDIELAFQCLAQNNLESIISKGYKNTERFSWGKASNKTLNVLCEASSSKCDRVI